MISFKESKSDTQWIDEKLEDQRYLDNNISKHFHNLIEKLHSTKR